MRFHRVNPYAEPTIELVLEILKDADHFNLYIDKLLLTMANEIIEEYSDVFAKLEKQGKSNIKLEDEPEIYLALKQLEDEVRRRHDDELWFMINALSYDLAKAYEKSYTSTFGILNLPIQEENGMKFIAPTINGVTCPQVIIYDSSVFEQKIKIPWCQDGKTYSDRLYSNVSQFQSKLAFVLEEGINKGKGLDWMIDSWRKLTGSAVYEATRLIKTESMAMWSMATKESYLTAGVEYVEILGDALCGGICLDYVGEAIPLKEAELGDLLPPYHPNCACSFCAYTEEVEIDSNNFEDLE